MRALSRLALAGEGDVKPLREWPGQYRLRVGGYRVRFVLTAAQHTLHVLRVDTRGDAYR